jgi:TRAP-type mannitol/chloroaromatic compound transport system substrate-binding protein
MKILKNNTRKNRIINAYRSAVTKYIEVANESQKIIKTQREALDLIYDVRAGLEEQNQSLQEQLYEYKAKYYSLVKNLKL